MGWKSLFSKTDVEIKLSPNQNLSRIFGEIGKPILKFTQKDNFSGEQLFHGFAWVFPRTHSI